MKPTISAQSILQEIASIKRMERGKLSVTRQGPSGPYYNFQRWQDGRNFTEYVPTEQIAQVQQNIESYQRFEALMKQYADSLTEQTRLERNGGVKKKTSILKSLSPKKPKSKT